MRYLKGVQNDKATQILYIAPVTGIAIERSQRFQIIAEVADHLTQFVVEVDKFCNKLRY